MTRDDTTYWVCVDCLMMAAGYDEHELGREYPTDPAPLSRVPEGHAVVTGLMASEHDTPCGSFNSALSEFLGGECECDRRTFGTWPCDGCGSPLAGERHALTVWSVTR